MADERDKKGTQHGKPAEQIAASHNHPKKSTIGKYTKKRIEAMRRENGCNNG